jgi:hypothetical protein
MSAACENASIVLTVQSGDVHLRQSNLRLSPDPSSATSVCTAVTWSLAFTSSNSCKIAGKYSVRHTLIEVREDVTAGTSRADGALGDLPGTDDAEESQI